MKLALTFWAIGASVAHADATLVYQLTGPGAEPTEKKLSISRFFVRVDDPADKKRYLLFQAGKFFPLYRVDESEQTYTLLTPPVKPTLHAGSKATAKSPATTQTPVAPAKPEADQTAQGSQTTEAAANDQPVTHQEGGDAAEPREPGVATDEPDAAKVETADLAPSPRLKPTKKTRSVAGIECRVILELADGEPIVEHCMANKARLGITERESRTLARVFVLAREKDFDWLGAATADEDFVSVQSRDLRSNKTLELKSVSTAALPSGYLRIPRSFKETEASDLSTDAKRDMEGEPPAASPPKASADAAE